MFTVVFTVLKTLKSTVSSRADLRVEIVALRQQLEVFRRQNPRPRLRRSDRVFWIWLCRTWPKWKSALVLVKPDTVLSWHRAGYRRYWLWKSRGQPGRPSIPRRHQGNDGIPNRLPCCLSPPDPESGRPVARPVLGGVHHDYRLAEKLEKCPNKHHFGG